MVFHNHGHTQILLTIGGNLAGNGIGSAAKAPGHNNSDLLFRESAVRRRGSFLLGIACAVGGRSRGFAAAGSQTQNHSECEDQRHEFFHCFLSSFH